MAKFQKGTSGNPGGRPKLPTEMREMFQAKAPEAFEVLTQASTRQRPKGFGFCGQAILDRAYGRPVQSIDVREDGPTVRYIAEVPEKCATTEEWLESIRREDAERSLVTSVQLPSMTSKRIRRTQESAELVSHLSRALAPTITQQKALVMGCLAALQARPSQRV